MTSKNSALWVLALGLSTMTGACDHADDVPTMELSPRRRAGPGTGLLRTLNTNQWVGSSARDIYEFSPWGDPHTNSFGYQTQLTAIRFDPPGPLGMIETDVGDPAANEPVALIGLDIDELTVAVSLPPHDADPVFYQGADIVGLQLGFEVTHSEVFPSYPVVLEVVGYDDDPTSGALYDIHKVDPFNGAYIAPLCEEDANLGRYARIYDALTVDGQLGTIEYVNDGALHHIACTSSAPGKASLYGYDPEEVDLETFVLINRVIRADYCGDGHPYTYPGNSLIIYDNFTSGHATDLDAVEDIEGSTVEAVWGLDGVLCVNKPRTANLDRQEIVCPIKVRPNGDLVHNWQPPSCDDYVEPTDDPDLDPSAIRVYSKTADPVVEVP